MSLKQLVFLFLTFVLTIGVKAQNRTLVFVSETGNPFILSINHKQINKDAQSNVKVYDVEAGKQIISVTERINETIYKLFDSIIISEDPKFRSKEFTFGVSLVKNKLKLRFISTSEISGPEIPVIPEAPKETVPLVDNSLYGNLYQAKENKPFFFNNYNDSSGTCKIDLTEKDLGYALNLLKKANDEETKLKYLNTILEYNCYATQQVKLLLEVLPLEMDRLNSAKLAYSHISDKQNISTLLTVFKYQSLKDSYSDFLRDQENIVKQKNLKCATPINQSKFEELFNKIKNGGHENEKIVVAKKSLVNVCISTVQARSIAQLFTHDRETLEFMKSAFHVLTDKENAKNLVSEFQFNETKDEFLKYISQ